MPKSKYETIYKDLKLKIESGDFPQGELLPSENSLIPVYGCSRNTLRRAIARLVTDGYVQTIQGKGVRNIYIPVEQASYAIGDIESFKESSIRNKKQAYTRILQFTDITADEKIAKKTGFRKGTLLLYIQRLRFLNGIPLILDHNYFLKDAVPGLTPEIASQSVYEYLEGTVGLTIATSKRTLTVEHVTQIDEKYIDLKGYNCMAVITSQTFDDNGIQFEYTQSRHHPDYFQFQDVATRKTR